MTGRLFAQLDAEDYGHICAVLEEHERLKEAVRWERECLATFAWQNNTMANVRADLEIHRSSLAASRAVDGLI